MINLRTTTIASGVTCIIVGSGAYMLSQEPACLVVLVIGFIQTALGLLIRSELRWPAVTTLVIAGVVMMLTAQSITRFIHILMGQTQTSPGAVLAFTVLSVVCLVHLTIGIRWVIAKKHNARS